MCTVETTLRLLREYGTVMAALVTALVFLWSVVQFFLVRNRDAANRDFEVYHQLIEKLVKPDAGSTIIFLDQQAAAVFELRHFLKYREFSLRTLTHLRNAWKTTDDSRTRLLDEIALTIAYLEAQPKRKG